MHKILIDGTWIEALSESSREIKNPATLKLLGTVPDCGPEDVARAVAAAKARSSIPKGVLCGRLPCGRDF